MMDRQEIIEEIRAIAQAPALHDLHRSTSAELGDCLPWFLERFQEDISRVRSDHAPLDLRLLDELSDELIRQFAALESNDRGRLAKALVADSLAGLPDRLAISALPAEILIEYVVATKYISASLIDEPDGDYGDRSESTFDRDLRVCELLTVPAGAQIVDFRVWLPKSFYRNNGMRKNLRSLAFVADRPGGRGPLFRIHTDTRNLTDFNEDGWNRCYLRIAGLLDMMSEVKGMVGTSWFYDPQLVDISPRLAYPDFGRSVSEN